MSTFKLDADVAMPGRRNRYPFEQMTSGQSFEIVGLEESRKVRNAAYQFAKKVNTDSGIAKGAPGYVSFALRKTDEYPDLDMSGNQKTQTVKNEETGETKTVKLTVKVFRLWRE